MENIAGNKPTLTWVVHLSMALLVVLWIFPTLGLLISSFRTADQIATSGWWRSLVSAEQNLTLRTQPPDSQVQQGELYVIEGNLFSENDRSAGEISRFGISSRDIAAFGPGETATLRSGANITVEADGAYRLTNSEPLSGSRGPRVFITALVAPEFTLANYDTVLGQGVAQRLLMFLAAGAATGLILFFGGRAALPTLPAGGLWTGAIVGGAAVVVGLASTLGLSAGEAANAQTTDSMTQAFFNTLTVSIPATVIPILIAAFAAYALAWMEFPGRALLITAIVALLVVPLQLALIPLLKFHNAIDIGKGYLGVWMAHTGFGLPLAIYLLRNYMVGLPRDIIENAKVDGATDFQVFTRIVLPLSFPALAAFAIFQFLWTWNDLLVALVFLIDASGETTVMTRQIVELLGTRGGNWEILATAAGVSIAVPLVVFFALQRYLVRGLLAGSVK
ncbi:MAG: carbohydrate ABC transporter permease [Rhodobacteraceae bacterium]|nr:carbohydrate ABC transporter permease [Paracoccaceae bacterium]